MTRVSELILTFLLNAAWQIVAITIIAAIGSLLLKHTAASYRHALWLAALFLSFLLPLWTVLKVDPETLSADVPIAFERTAEIVGAPTTQDSSKPAVARDVVNPSVTNLFGRRRH